MALNYLGFGFIVHSGCHGPTTEYVYVPDCRVVTEDSIRASIKIPTLIVSQVPSVLVFDFKLLSFLSAGSSIKKHRLIVLLLRWFGLTRGFLRNKQID